MAQASSACVDSLRMSQCLIILAAAFLGWLLAGVHLAITSIVMRVAAANLMPEAGEGEVGKWFGFLVCAFLFGAAAGGYVFGYLGDRVGRAKAMAASILCYSLFSGATYFAQTPLQLLALRFLTCLGVGGMWPNGIALVSEAWPNISRPILAGAIGTAANIGILCFSILTLYVHVTPSDWRWTMLVGFSPVVLGLLSLAIVPESPKWLAARSGPNSSDSPSRRQVGLAEIFQPPLLQTTLIGILLGTVPLFGGWGTANWANAWASEAGDRPNVEREQTMTQEGDEGATADPTLKSWTLVYRSLPGSISSLLGGALALILGRRRSYFLLCLCALTCTQFLFRVESPSVEAFKYWNGALGFFSGFFFGWLPLCLPELFPTRIRSTGAGVSFNFGRILTGLGVLISAFALKALFEGRYASIGQISGFIYAVGMIAILFAPDTSRTNLDD